MRVLVLGNNGMLASIMYDYLKLNGLDVSHTQREDINKPLYLDIQEQYSNVKYLDTIPSSFDYIINCIGVIRANKKLINDLKVQFYVNAIFPSVLQEFCKWNSINIIHISTDGVFSGNDGPYFEDSLCDGSDIYSISKTLGEVFAPNVLNIRCSIIGNEKSNNSSLLNWFLSKKNDEIVEGYSNHIWNGVTTLQLTKFIHSVLISNSYASIVASTNIIHYSPNLPLSKFELLLLINKIYNRNITIIPSKSPINVNRTLNSLFSHFYNQHPDSKMNFEDAIIELRNFSLNHL